VSDGISRECRQPRDTKVAEVDPIKTKIVKIVKGNLCIDEKRNSLGKRIQRINIF